MSDTKREKPQQQLRTKLESKLTPLKNVVPGL